MRKLIIPLYLKREAGVGADPASNVEANNDAEVSPTTFRVSSPSYSMINAYAPTHAMGLKFMRATMNKQPGDPKKAAKVIADIVRGEGVAEGKETPDWLLLGKDCVGDVREKCHLVLKNAEVWEAVSASTDLD
jgi:hypothetical protein